MMNRAEQNWPDDEVITIRADHADEAAQYTPKYDGQFLASMTDMVAGIDMLPAISMTVECADEKLWAEREPEPEVFDCYDLKLLCEKARGGKAVEFQINDRPAQMWEAYTRTDGTIVINLVEVQQ